MQINDLSAHISTHKQVIKAAIERVLTRGQLVLGPEVNDFEAAFAEYLGVSHCVSLANGTDAIELALRAMNILPGDRVATVANAGMYTTTALLAIGAEPFFMDVNPVTHNATLSEVDKAISLGVKAVVVTHLYGLAVPQICEIAQHCLSHGVKLLEDCAQAHGAFISGQRVGTFGDSASFSFYPTKNLGALGDGGAVVTNCEKIAKKVLQLRQYGWTKKYQVEIGGACNSRLDEIQAAVLRALLPKLDTANAKRRQIAAQYSTHIKHPKVWVPQQGGVEFVAHLYVVHSACRNALHAHLHTADIASDVHYPIPDYRQPIWGKRFTQVYLPNTERLSKEVLTLPCYPEMTEDAARYVITTINEMQI